MIVIDNNSESNKVTLVVLKCRPIYESMYNPLMFLHRTLFTEKVKDAITANSTRQRR